MLHGGKVRDVGRMDRVIEVYNRVANDTDYSHNYTNVLVSTEWAEEIPVTRMMREDVMGGKEASIQEVRWRVRYECPATTSHSVKWDGYFYDIITILNEGRDYKVLVTQLRPDNQWPG